jgi:UDPglucose 6-dehydrogenase
MNIIKKEVDMKSTFLVMTLLILCNHISAQDFQKHKVCVLGTGYVGLVLATGLAEFGHDVIATDISSEKIDMLNKGEIPIYEPGLDQLVGRNVNASRLFFLTDIEKAIKRSDVIFIAVGTPMSDDGTADLSYIRSACSMIGKHLNGYKVVCTKSTVPVGTGDMIKRTISQHAPSNAHFDVVSNPEFLKEGNAVKDFLDPNRIVVGAESEKAHKILNDIYIPLINRGTRVVKTDIRTAEMIKYASNSFLATKISFINELSRLCEKTGANITDVSCGMSLDERIGKHFLSPGPGFGGSCFPKDVAALSMTARRHNTDLSIIDSALSANKQQVQSVIDKVYELADNDVKGKRIAILGLAFKAQTDDIRHSCAMPLIKQLRQDDALISAYDPQAMKNMKKEIPDIDYAFSADDALKNADMVVVLTEWNEFKKLDMDHVKSLLNHSVLLDARNIISTDQLTSLGYRYVNIGNAYVA